MHKLPSALHLQKGSNNTYENVLHQTQQWERIGELSAEEMEFIESLQSHCEETSFSIVSDTSLENTEEEKQIEECMEWKHEMKQFFTIKSENKTEYPKNILQIKQLQQMCQNIIQGVLECAHLSEELQEQYTRTVTRTGMLHHDCEQLVHEREQLVKISEGISSRLQYFLLDENPQEEREMIAVVQGAIDPKKFDLFSKSMRRIDESITFLSNHQHYKDAKPFLSKFKQLQTKGLTNLREFIISKINKVTQTISDQMKPKTPTTPSSNPQVVETSLLYVDYKVELDSIKPFIFELELRSSKEENIPYLLSTFATYLQSRQKLTYGINESKFKALKQGNDLAAFLRLGSAHLIQISTQEEKLFRYFFSSDLLQLHFKNLIEMFCLLLYEELRSILVHSNDIDALCEAIEILRVEILEQSIKSKQLPMIALENIVHKMIQDVQERLIYKSSVFIKEHIRNFVPKPTDLNYPSNTTNTMQWYPTLSLTLDLLSKLYNSLEVGVFEGLAQEAVALCTNSFILASRKIGEKHPIDAELFLIKHLLAFRESLSQFHNANFVVTESSLDFSSLRQSVSRFLKGESSFKIQNIVIDILSQSRPRIVYNSVDSKKDLDKHLKSACEGFILNTVKAAMEPIMKLVKRKAVITKIVGEQSDSNSPAVELCTVEEASKALNDSHTAMQETLSGFDETMSQYLKNATTRLDLIQPIKVQLVEIYEQFVELVTVDLKQENSELQTLKESLLTKESLVQKLDELLFAKKSV